MPEGADSVSQRPCKRRKIEPAESPANPNTDLLFAPLLKGLEKLENTRIRSDLFERSWRPMETLLKVHRQIFLVILRAIVVDIRQQIHDNASTETAKEVASFIRNADPVELVSSILVDIVH